MPYCEDPMGGRKPINAKCETVRALLAQALHRAGGWLKALTVKL